MTDITDDLTAHLAKAIRAAWVDRLDWDELAQGALKFLSSTGRLVPAGGMALTAERVEDVRTAREALRGYRNFDGYTRPHVNRLIEAIDSLFSATDPAECEYRCEEGIATAGVGVRCPACTAAARDKAATEPAKEEPKTKRCPSEIEGWGCSLTNGHDGDHTAHDQDGPAYVWPASSPVVPAPTETGPQTLEGPWDRIEDIPKTVGRVTDRDGDAWEWDGDNWVTPETAILPTTYINRKYAPFVAAEEG